MPTWKPISSAPRDGRPVWVRGNNYGNKAEGQHYTWAYWDGDFWKEAAVQHSSRLIHLAEWLDSIP